MGHAFFKFVEYLFYFLMFAGNTYFVTMNGITTFFSYNSSGFNHIGLALAICQAVFFAPGAYKFVDGFFRWKYRSY